MFFLFCAAQNCPALYDSMITAAGPCCPSIEFAPLRISTEVFVVKDGLQLQHQAVLCVS